MILNHIFSLKIQQILLLLLLFMSMVSLCFIMTLIRLNVSVTGTKKKKKFRIKKDLGPISYCLGMKIHRNDSKNIIKLSHGVPFATLNSNSEQFNIWRSRMQCFIPVKNDTTCKEMKYQESEYKIFLLNKKKSYKFYHVILVKLVMQNTFRSSQDSSTSKPMQPVPVPRCLFSPPRHH